MRSRWLYGIFLSLLVVSRGEGASAHKIINILLGQEAMCLQAIEDTARTGELTRLSHILPRYEQTMITGLRALAIKCARVGKERPELGDLLGYMEIAVRSLRKYSHAICPNDPQAETLCFQRCLTAGLITREGKLIDFLSVYKFGLYQLQKDNLKRQAEMIKEVMEALMGKLPESFPNAETGFIPEWASGKVVCVQGKIRLRDFAEALFQELQTSAQHTRYSCMENAILQFRLCARSLLYSPPRIALGRALAWLARVFHF